MKSRRTEKQELKNETRRIMEEEERICEEIHYKEAIGDSIYEMALYRSYMELFREREKEQEELERLRELQEIYGEPHVEDDYFDYNPSYYGEGYLFS